jgi:hypothetical protein
MSKLGQRGIAMTISQSKAASVGGFFSFQKAFDLRLGT